LAIKFPTERDDLKKVVLDVLEKSSNGMLDGCVAALDGWLCRIKVPLHPISLGIINAPV